MPTGFLALLLRFKRACNTPRLWKLRQKTERISFYATLKGCQSQYIWISTAGFRLRQCRVQTTQGELVWDTLAQKVGWTTAVGELTEQHFSQARDDLFVRQLEHFFDCIENHTPPRISLQDGVEVLKIIEKVKQSHLLGERVTL